MQCQKHSEQQLINSTVPSTIEPSKYPPKLECHEGKSNTQNKNQKSCPHPYSEWFRYSFKISVQNNVMMKFTKNKKNQRYNLITSFRSVCCFLHVCLCVSFLLRCRPLIEQTNGSVCGQHSWPTNRRIIINLTYLLAFFTCFLWAVISN